MNDPINSFNISKYKIVFYLEIGKVEDSVDAALAIVIGNVTHLQEKVNYIILV